MVELHRICSSFVCCVKIARSDHTVCLACTFVKIHIWGRLQMFSCVLFSSYLHLEWSTWVFVCKQMEGARPRTPRPTTFRRPERGDSAHKKQSLKKSQEISKTSQQISNKSLLRKQKSEETYIYIKKNSRSSAPAAFTGTSTSTSLREFT